MTSLRRLADESTGRNDQSYTLTRVYHLGDFTVRISVHRDFYPSQSWAAAEVFTPALTWTRVLTAPASEWHPHTRAFTPALDRTRVTSPAAGGGEHPAEPDFEGLGEIADDLIDRAAKVLLPGETVITTAPTPDPLGPVLRITERQELVDLAAVLGMRPDWHEPDAYNVTAEVGGSTFDNAGFWPTETVTVGDPQHELFVRLVQDGRAVADVNLATLFAWATGHTPAEGVAGALAAADDIECALITLAEMWNGCDPDQDLSERQHAVAKRVYQLWQAGTAGT
jgi:hypothetical protein